MPDNAIQVRQLVKTYNGTSRSGPKQALKSIDLDIPAGSIFGLLGPNGAGKSTFINILAGLVNKTSGTVDIWGFDQDKNPRQSRAAIGVVPQELNFDAYFTPAQALDVQAGLYGVPKSERQTMEILRRVGLEDKAHSYARTLSGGMRRRLLVAKALVHAPPILVLDEPTAGVDIELRQMLWDYVRELNDAGTTVILTTHYLEEAEAMCDRIAIVNHGEVVACKDTEEMLGLLDAKTLLLRIVTPLDAAPDISAARSEMREPDLLALTYGRSQANAPDLIKAVQSKGIEISDITTEEPHLEEVFLALTASEGQPTLPVGP
ncbi:MAG: ABC transporter ATP-binding protein [Pseudomonadota bacterium]